MRTVVICHSLTCDSRVAPAVWQERGRGWVIDDKVKTRLQWLSPRAARSGRATVANEPDRSFIAVDLFHHPGVHTQSAVSGDTRGAQRAAVLHPARASRLALPSVRPARDA